MLTLNYIFNFGKHQGKQVEDVIYDDPDYITWLYENNEDEIFDTDVIELLEKRKII